jgi:hypothetical protein
MDYVDRSRIRMQKKMNLIGLKNVIHHSYLQFYKMEDLETVHYFTAWLENMNQNVITNKEIEEIRNTAVENIESGNYESILEKMDGKGSYASKVVIEDLINKLSNY